jgi:hypothetical protein
VPQTALGEQEASKKAAKEADRGAAVTKTDEPSRPSSQLARPCGTCTGGDDGGPIAAISVVSLKVSLHRPFSLVAVILLVQCGSAGGAAPGMGGSDAGMVATPPDMGDLGPTDPAPLATSPGNDEDPSVLRAADGQLYLVWFSNRSGNEDLYVKSSANGRDWSSDRAILPGPEHDFYPSMIQAKDGLFHLVWWRGDVGPAGKIVGSIWYASALDTAPRLTPAGPPGLYLLVWVSDAGGDLDIYHRFVKL